jgi:hypothetical protein
MFWIFEGIRSESPGYKWRELYRGPHRLYDLRRTAASQMGKLKVPRLHIAKVLNHSTGDITGVYDRHDYATEKRGALDKWATELAAIVTAKKVGGSEHAAANHS